MSLYVLDTNAVADLMGKRAHSYARFRACLSRGDPMLLCPVVLYEVERGLRAQPEASTKRQAFDLLREDLEYREPSESVWLEAAALWVSSRREGRPRADNDLLIAAFGRVSGGTLVTKNTQDFEGIGIPLEDWSLPA